MISGKSQGGSGMDKKKITAVVFVVVLAVVIWQLFGLMRGGSSEATTITPVNATATATTDSKGPTSAPPSSKLPAQTVVPSTQQQIVEVPVSKEVDFYRSQQDAQQKYIGSLNELQNLRIQKEIEETSESIAAAKLARVTAEKSIADLLTKPNQSVTSNTFGTVLGVPPSNPPAGEARYVLVSISMQLGKWTAVLNYQGKPYQVSIGSILPADGSEVEDINESSIVLKKDGEKRKVTLVPTI